MDNVLIYLTFYNMSRIQFDNATHIFCKNDCDLATNKLPILSEATICKNQQLHKILYTGYGEVVNLFGFLQPHSLMNLYMYLSLSINHQIYRYR
mgnify:CR=1 FL=1